MPFRVLVGLPSFNEADTIGSVTADIDAALVSLPFRAEVLLVNADNASTDGTPEAFLSIPTGVPKKVLTTEYAGGKGSNTAALLRLAREQNFDAVLSVDTDLAEVPATWIHALLGAVHDGIDFCYPLRPPTWNGGDLTYQLAYPVLAGLFGADLREPLCGDVALSRRAAECILAEAWTAGELRYGGDLLIASLAATHSWATVTLSRKRRNKLRSFSICPSGDYRMGGKFADNAFAVQRCAARRLQQPSADHLIASPSATPDDPQFIVPEHDPDIARLALSTARRLRQDARDGLFAVFPATLADRLHRHATSGEATQGLPWPDWRQCLFAWIRNHDAPPDQTIPVDLLETLFLNRVVGHHTEIAGITGWYTTVRNQAQDLFTHRHAVWPST
ncbi:MAG: hypothetical protein ACRDTE_25835 [Pseudonocardiaceae bacterium]